MSIGKKLTAWLIFIILCIGSFSAYVYSTFEMKEEKERLESLGNTIGPILEQGLTNYMMKRDFDVLDKTLHDVGSIKPITRIWLINTERTIKVSTNKKDAGTVLSHADQRCVTCHDKKQKGLFLKEDRIFRWVQPIKNKIECHKCHSSSTKYNGIFVIDFSLDELATHVRADILRGLMVFFLSLVAIGFIMLVLSNNIMIKRLNEVIDKVKKFKDGDYNVRIPFKGKDEITNLTESFNEMAKAINDRDGEKDILFKQVSRSYEQWQNTFDSITDMISIHDSDFNIIRANKAFTEHFGLHPQDLTNKKCYEIFHGNDSPVEGCPHVITLHENRPETVEILNPKTNQIFRISTFPFNYPDADFHGTIHIAKDITEEKEKEIRLIISDRLSALGQMASGIAHEINNPLASIAGCAEGLLNKVKSGKYDSVLFEEYLKIIEEEIERCKDITIGMLSFVREKTYEKKEVSINESIDKTLEIISFQGRLKGIRIIRDYKEGIPHVYGSEGELRQVFMAIITNALDAMEDNGTLTLVTGTEDNTVFAKISDTGTGISTDNLNRIFTPFFTTKSDRGGTGLGLSIAKKIIIENKGNIEITSEESKGTTVKITFLV